jgi:TRAP-type C4-dicarboxylate transport system substrate-binding protein
MKTKFRLLVAVLTASMLSASIASAETIIKIATVAPRGSIWMRYFNKMKAKIAKKTGGEVKLRFYPGQVQGDERDVVRKMRTGQLHGGSFTAVGLSMINPKALVMQMPMMFRKYVQIDKVKKALKAEFEKSFEQKGYVLLGWSEMGWVHLFTVNDVRNLEQLRNQRVWVWNDDPISKAMMRKLRIKPRMLGLPNVYPALNTGMINTVLNSPLGAMALQWHTKAKYMLAEPLAIGIGATVIKKSVFDKLSADHQRILKGYAEKYHRALTKRIRKDNERAKAALKAAGIKMVSISAADKKVFEGAASKVARSFVPRYYPQALLKKVLDAR